MLSHEENQLLEWLGSLAVPHRIVVTKVDKLSASERGAALNRFRDASRGVLGPLFVSGQTGDGLGAIWRVIQATMTSPHA